MATSCRNSVMFGAVTPEKRFVYFCTFVKKNAKMGIFGRLSQNTLDRSQPNTWYSALIDIWVEIINLTFVFRSLNGTLLYGNQLICGFFANV